MLLESLRFAFELCLISIGHLLHSVESFVVLSNDVPSDRDVLFKTSRELQKLFGLLLLQSSVMLQNDVEVAARYRRRRARWLVDIITKELLANVARVK